MRVSGVLDGQAIKWSRLTSSEKSVAYKDFSSYK